MHLVTEIRVPLWVKKVVPPSTNVVVLLGFKGNRHLQFSIVRGGEDIVKES